MRTKYITIIISLLIGLFIYLFYRTDRTFVNEIAISLISSNNYYVLKHSIVSALPLSEVIIYSLPEGLWVFCITITSRPFYIRLAHRRFDCLLLPMLYCVMLEIFQLLHITNGRFDMLDILVSGIFFILGAYVIKDHSAKQNLFTRPDKKVFLCVASYCIVYLAHVFK